jgi:hypothetical protein
MTRDLNDINDLVDSIIDAPKKRRGMNAHSQWLIKHMIPIVEAAKPITGRGVGYKLFVATLIKSMSQNDMQRVYRLLKEARERGMIPWDSIVDEGRQLERKPSWDDPKAFAESALRSYRLDFWEQQPERCEVWSEKGTIRGVLQPVLDKYGVGFRVMHGYASATVVNDVATIYGDDDRPLTALYVGDWDPSGLHMSVVDLPNRLEDYGGGHVKVIRVALTEGQLAPLPSFPASDKRKDPRYEWFVSDYGHRCWEIDALDPNELRDRVKDHIEDCILDPETWERCEQVCEAQRDSMRGYLEGWVTTAKGQDRD